MTIGERIQEARKQAGLKQSELAEIVGVAVITIGQYERDKRQPRLEQLRRIALALNTTVAELVEPGYWDTVSSEELYKAWNDDSYPKNSCSITIEGSRDKMNAAFDQLNYAGQQKAVERVEELTEIPKYQRQEPESAGKAPTTPSEGKETTQDN